MRESIPQITKWTGHHRADNNSRRLTDLNDSRLAVVWAESFLYAGSSAFLLLISSLYPVYWYVSCIALVPLLYRIIWASTAESLRLGFLFGLTYGCVAFAGGLLEAPVAVLLKLATCTALLALFAWGISRTRDKLGFNPVIVALIWIVFEITLVRLGLLSSPLAESGIQSESLLHGMAVLFGFLIVSFAIVCLNAVIAAFLNLCMSDESRREAASDDDSSALESIQRAVDLLRGFFFLPEGRAPPN
ncbi:MAG: hypothetical protein KKG33_12010 [candidate division Zixibacteria bacterium]|nr:hypothetical protein [candidate division Zixibacteria bacterium]MBU1470007.1 hypothetical protein [candidate division Zixibacteria bacterium]MBU2626273.1 hypothetical protein [candidate division Zixibacteria bacterium]